MPGSIYHRYPDFITYQKRLESFRANGFQGRVKPEILASAGLFYGGQNDGVMCFSCGIGMRRLNPDEDPWILHAKYSSKCSFVTQEKDPEFIKAHARDYSQLPYREEENFELVEPCKVCKSRNVNTVFIPCGHYISCERCASGAKHCAACDAPILERLRTFLS